jgi:hypothetical protein
MNNENDNFLVKIAAGIIHTFERLLVVFFDGLDNAVNHANPSMFSLDATLLPYVLPLPVAFMTAHSAQAFFGWDMWAAYVLGFGLEGLGLLTWVRLVDVVLESKQSNSVYVFGSVAAVYEILLVFLNVVLAWTEGADWQYIVVLFCVCLLPALSAILYGSQRQTAIARLENERAEAKAEAERIRQERRQDRKEAAAMKIQYAKDAEAVKLKSFRNK